MKKFLIKLLLIVLIVSLSGPITEKVNIYIEEKKIEESKPTQKERLQFVELLNDNTYYYFNGLNDKEKEAYITMYSSFMNFDEAFVMEINGESLKTVFTAVLYDNPHIFWVDNEYQYLENEKSVSFTPNYRNTPAEAQVISTQLNEKISNIIFEADKLNIDYEKELYIHDYVCNNTVYDENISPGSGDSAHDSLLYGSAICEGYSRAIQILLDAVDIDNYLVVGEGKSEGTTEPHMWNVVEIDNQNYYLDATWDDSGVDDTIVYFYFNVNEEMISDDHFNIEPSNNNCDSDSAYYYAVNGSYIKEFKSYSAHANRSASVLRKGENKVEFIFKYSTVYKKAIEYIEEDKGFFDYVYAAVKSSGRRINPYKISYYTIDDRNYLCIVFG